MSSKPNTIKSFYIINLLLFIGLGIHFFILNDQFIAFLLFFIALVNAFAYFQISKKVSDQSIFVDIFNGLILLISAYNYGEMNLFYWMIFSGIIMLVYFSLAIRQYIMRAKYRSLKKRKMKHFS